MKRFLIRTAEGFWEWLIVDLPAMIIALLGWVLGRTWIEFGLRLTIVGMLVYLVRALWTRLSDADDSSPLTTIGMFALLGFVAILAVTAYTSGLWRELRPAW